MNLVGPFWCFFVTANVRCAFLIIVVVTHSEAIRVTLPTWPLWSMTLIPRGWYGDLVKSRCTSPRVSCPLRWCSFWMTQTSSPGVINSRKQPRPGLPGVVGRGGGGGLLFRRRLLFLRCPPPLPPPVLLEELLLGVRLLLLPSSSLELAVVSVRKVRVGFALIVKANGWAWPWATRWSGSVTDRFHCCNWFDRHGSTGVGERKARPDRRNSSMTLIMSRINPCRGRSIISYNVLTCIIIILTRIL